MDNLSGQAEKLTGAEREFYEDTLGDRKGRLSQQVDDEYEEQRKQANTKKNEMQALQQQIEEFIDPEEFQEILTPRPHLPRKQRHREEVLETASSTSSPADQITSPPVRKVKKN